MAQDRTTTQLAILILRKNSGFPAAARALLGHISTAEQLAEWLTEYATPDDRRRLATAIRQARHRSRHHIKRVPVSPETHARLRTGASKAGLPISQFLDRITREVSP